MSPSTSDGALTQLKFSRLLKATSVYEDIVENKCIIYLGINLKHTYAESIKAINSEHKSDSSNSECDCEVVSDPDCSDFSSETVGDQSNDDSEHELPRHQNHDIDRYVHEICKLFGLLGGPEYAQGNYLNL